MLLENPQPVNYSEDKMKVKLAELQTKLNMKPDAADFEILGLAYNENDRKSLENNDLSSVDKIIVDNFVNDDFDVNKILSHAYSSFYKMEQQRLGFKDFNCFSVHKA